jgi:hypothetical protein
MKQPRRWVALLTTLIMTVSLVSAPPEGSARSVGPQPLPGDPRPTQEMGAPDIPPSSGRLTSWRVSLPAVLLAIGIQVDVAVVLGVTMCSAVTRPLACTLRPAARP